MKGIILKNTPKNPDGFGRYSADAALLEWSESAGRAFSPNCPKLSRSTLTSHRSREVFLEPSPREIDPHHRHLATGDSVSAAHEPDIHDPDIDSGRIFPDP